MTVDFSDTLYDPLYAVLGASAVLTVAGAGTGVQISVIDDTRPKALPITSAAQTADVQSVAPGAFVRIPELAGKGVARADYADAVLAFNGRTWVVRSWEIIGSPNGEDAGEVRFSLKAAAVG